MTWGQSIIAVMLAAGTTAIVVNAQSSLPTKSSNNQSSLTSPKVQDNFITNGNFITTTSTRPLKVSVSVDALEDLKVKQGDVVKEGQVIAENSRERNRLLTQKKAIELQLKQVQSIVIPKPIVPSEVPPIADLPPPNYELELAAIDQAKLRLEQANQLKEQLASTISTQSAGEAAEFERLNTNLEAAQNKVAQHEKLIEQMKELQLEDDVVQHETAVLGKLQSNVDAAQFELQTAKAKVLEKDFSKKQELSKLEINVQLAISELREAESRLNAAKSKRAMDEYNHKYNVLRRIEERNTAIQVRSRQEQEYIQSLGQQNYQIAQLQLALASIDDKLSIIPVYRAGRSGIVRRLKIEGQSNGKIQVTLTIADINSTNVNLDSLESNGTTTNTDSSTTTNSNNTRNTNNTNNTNRR